MGNQKQKWTSEEEEALRAGVAKHGTGKWKNILRDPEFAPSLTHRSNIDLKDKWRNISINAAHGSNAKQRNSKPKVLSVASVPSCQNSASALSLVDDDMTDDPSKSPQDNKTAPRYNAMIFEALSALKDSNGSDIGAIVNFIERRRYEVPPNFRRLLSSKLRRLVLQNKLEKFQNRYKIKKETPLGAKTTLPKQKETRPRPPQNSGLVVTSNVTVDEAAMTAAYRIAEAENKSFVAAEAVKVAERVSKMAEDTEVFLELMTEVYELCSRGEIVRLAA
ncbi:hypothetical protein NMG60_11004100 [Bertholletia excelsa]